MLVALPNVGSAGTADPVSRTLTNTLTTVQQTVQPTVDRLRTQLPQVPTPAAPAAPAASAPAAAQQQQPRAAAPRAAAQDSKTTPAQHGSVPHAQGTVAGAFVAPGTERPKGASVDGSDSDEQVIIGRARGQQGADGKYRGQINILSLFGHQILGVDTAAGETKHGPLDAIQTGLLDPIKKATNGTVAVDLLRADSSTTATGTSNVFKTLHVKLGTDKNGIETGVGESTGTISNDSTSQTSNGNSTVADVWFNGPTDQNVATVNKSNTDSNAKSDGTKSQANKSDVVKLFGSGVPLPSGGCADGTPDDVGLIPVVAPTVCNADDQNAQSAAPSGVREALSVFALDLGGTNMNVGRALGDPEQLLQAATAAAESSAVAPSGPDTPDNPNNPDTPGGPGDDGDNDNGGQNPGNDDNDGPGSDDDGPTGPGVDQPGDNRPQCSDGADNDGDGDVDAGDSGCLSGPNGAYNPNDDSEGGAVASRESGASLPNTGSDVLILAIGGLLLVALGGGLRRRMTRGVGA